MLPPTAMAAANGARAPAGCCASRKSAQHNTSVPCKNAVSGKLESTMPPKPRTRMLQLRTPAQPRAVPRKTSTPSRASGRKASGWLGPSDAHANVPLNAHSTAPANTTRASIPSLRNRAYMQKPARICRVILRKSSPPGRPRSSTKGRKNAPG